MSEAAYIKELKMFLTWLNNIDFSKLEDEIYGLKMVYATIELNSSESLSVSEDFKNDLLDAIGLLKRNTDVSGECFQFLSFVVASLNEQHNGKDAVETLLECGLSLPLDFKLFKPFSYTRQYNGYMPMFHRSFRDDLASIEYTFTSPEILKFNDTVILLNSGNKEILLKNLNRFFGVDRIKGYLYSVLSQCERARNDLYLTEIYFAIIFDKPVEKTTCVSFCSLLGKFWKLAILSEQAWNNTKYFENILPAFDSLLPFIFELEEFEDIEAKDIQENLKNNFFQVDEKNALMFLSNEDRKSISLSEKSFCNILSTHPILRDFILEKTMPSTVIEDIANDEFKV